MTDFFRINMPYGLHRNEKGEWMAFNREYMPLGHNTRRHQESFASAKAYSDLPVHTAYCNMTEELLLKIAHSVGRDENGEIQIVFLYDDGTNPMNARENKTKSFSEYFAKIEILSNLNAKY